MTTDVLGSLTNEPKPSGNDNAGDPLAALVGPDKKFKTNADLAKGVLEKDSFIEQLKSENADIRKALKDAEEKAAQGGTLKDLIERIEKATGQNGNQPSNLSREDIEKLVDNSLSKRDTQRERAANRAATNADLLKKYGNDSAKAADAVRQKAVELGLPPAILTEIAETSPGAFRELFGLGKPANQSSAPASLPDGRKPAASVASDGAPDKRGRSYYSKLRKELGHRYYEPSIQQQLMRDRRELGAQFNQL